MQVKGKMERPTGEWGIEELKNCSKSLSYREKKSISTGVLGPRSPSRSSKGLSHWSRSPRGETWSLSKILCEAGSVEKKYPDFSLPSVFHFPLGFPGLEPKWRPGGLRDQASTTHRSKALSNAREGSDGKGEIHHHNVQDTIQSVTQCRVLTQ